MIYAQIFCICRCSFMCGMSTVSVQATICDVIWPSRSNTPTPSQSPVISASITRLDSLTCLFTDSSYSISPDWNWNATKWSHVQGENIFFSVYLSWLWFTHSIQFKKLHYSWTFSCKRRGCSAICPNGSLITGQGTRSANGSSGVQRQLISSDT